MDMFITEIVKQGGGYILAASALFMLNAVWKARLEEIKARLVQEHDDKALLISVIQGNATALSDFRAVMLEVKTMLTDIRARQSAKDTMS